MSNKYYLLTYLLSLISGTVRYPNQPTGEILWLTFIAAWTGLETPGISPVIVNHMM